MARLITILTFFMLMNSCSKDVNLHQDDLNVAEIMEAFNEGKLTQDHGLLIEGKVDIVCTDQEVLVFVNLATANQKLFIIQDQNLASSHQLRQKMKDAQVLYLKRHLIIRAKEGNLSWLFYLDQDLPSYLTNISFAKTFKAYGLALQENFRLSNERIENFAKLQTVYSAYVSTKLFRENEVNNRSEVHPTILAADVQCKCCQTVTTTPTSCTHVIDDTCDAGGYGATSCSLTVNGSTCNVSCATGSTPCCWEAIENTDNDDGDELEEGS